MKMAKDYFQNVDPTVFKLPVIFDRELYHFENTLREQILAGTVLIISRNKKMCLFQIFLFNSGKRTDLVYIQPILISEMKLQADANAFNKPLSLLQPFMEQYSENTALQRACLKDLSFLTSVTAEFIRFHEPTLKQHHYHMNPTSIARDLS